jgi:hypothetical protein
MRRKIWGVGVVASAAIMALAGSGQALPPAPGSSCIGLPGGASGCCGDHATAVSSPMYSDGWGCECNDGYIGVAVGNSSACVDDPGQPGDPPGTPGGPNDPPEGGGGGGPPPNQECVEAPPVPPTGTMDPAGKFTPWTDVQRAEWLAAAKPKPNPDPDCKDKKKHACTVCQDTKTADNKHVNKEFDECKNAIEREATDGCHMGILYDGRIASGHSAAQHCADQHGGHWVPSCPSAMPEHETECSWSMPGGIGSLPDYICEENTEKWDACEESYYRGSGAVTTSLEVSGSASWNPVETITVSVGGKASETVTWAPQTGELAKCTKVRDAARRVAIADAKSCAKGVNDQYHGGQKCYP